MYEYAARVVRVVDGDSVHVDIDLGFRTWLRDVPVRVAHIDAPEIKTEAGKAARAYAEGLLTPEKAIVLHSHEWDKFGRVLGSIDMPADVGEIIDFGTAMIAAGHAVKYEGGTR